MIRIYADFNDHDAGAYWNLHYGDTPFGEMATNLAAEPGARVILYQDEDDFEVEATLAFERVAVLERECWVARPDWPTIVRFETNKAAE